MVNTLTSDIILDSQIKTGGSWVVGVDFLCQASNKRAVSATALPKQNINDLQIELGHPSETMTQATAKALGIQVTDTFKPC